MNVGKRKRAESIEEFEQRTKRSFLDLWPYLCGKTIEDMEVARAVASGLGLSIASVVTDKPRRRVLRYGVLDLLVSSTGLSKSMILKVLTGGTKKVTKTTAMKMQEGTKVPAAMWIDPKGNPLSSGYMTALKRLRKG